MIIIIIIFFFKLLLLLLARINNNNNNYPLPLPPKHNNINTPTGRMKTSKHSCGFAGCSSCHVCQPEESSKNYNNHKIAATQYQMDKSNESQIILSNKLDDANNNRVNSSSSTIYND